MQHLGKPYLGPAAAWCGAALLKTSLFASWRVEENVDAYRLTRLTSAALYRIGMQTGDYNTLILAREQSLGAEKLKRKILFWNRAAFFTEAADRVEGIDRLSERLMDK